MKIKGLRWWIIGLIMLITIINYLDRGTLNYMWLANIDYILTSSPQTESTDANFAVRQGNRYILKNTRGKQQTVPADIVTVKKNKGKTVIVHKEGIAIDLGLVDVKDTNISAKAKDLLGRITIFFMIAYGISQLFSGKIYDKVGCRKGFFGSVLIWGLSDALTSLSRGTLSLTFF